MVNIKDVIQEIGHIPFTNSLHTFVFSLLQKGRFEEALHHYRKSQEYESWLLTDEQLARQRCKRKNIRNRKVYGTNLSNIKKYKLRLYKAQGFKCNICKGKKPASNLEIDHIQAATLGGNSYIKNLQLLCKACHIEKDAVLINRPLEKQIDFSTPT
jgi:5-methylcytosine-specific restriction endonuclease McrA